MSDIRGCWGKCRKAVTPTFFPQTARKERRMSPVCYLRGNGGEGRRFATWARVSRARSVPVDFAGLHDEDYAADGGDVVERVAVDRDEIGLHAFGDGADLAGEAERLGCHGRAADDCVHGLVAAVLDAVDELFGVAAMGSGDGVGPENY